MRQWIMGCGVENCGNPFCKCGGKCLIERSPPFQAISTAGDVAKEKVPTSVLLLTKTSVQSSKFWICKTFVDQADE